MNSDQRLRQSSTDGSTECRSGAPFRPSARIAAIAVSEILQITADAAALKQLGRPMLILGTGEPDFDTPEPIKEAAARAMKDGATKYTNLAGSPQLRAAVSAKFKRENGLDYRPSEIICCAGAKQIIFNAFMATLNPGDEVIIPAPFWTSYADIVTITGGIPVIIPCQEANGFRLTAEDLDRAINPATRWLLLNSPSNPSGAAYGESHLRDLAAVLRRHPDVWVMSDDMYEHIVYDDFSFATIASVDPSLKDRALTVNGVSKAYAMTGWRLGYAGGPKALIDGMTVVQSQSTSCPSSISQAAAVEALNGPQDIVRERARAFQRRRDIVVDALNEVPGLRCRRPEGAFYTYTSCAGLLGRKIPGGGAIESDRDYCKYLMDRADVAVVPGTCFGLAPYFRISYATSEAELVEACRRIAEATFRLA
jgi:aspartate aminotransferase